MTPDIIKELLIDAMKEYFGSGVEVVISDIQNDILTFRFKTFDLNLKYSIDIKKA